MTRIGKYAVSVMVIPLAAIYEDLRGDGPPPIQYGDLFIIKLPDNDGPSVVSKRRFVP